MTICGRKEKPSIDGGGEAFIENETETAFNSRVEKFKMAVAKRSSLYGGKKVAVVEVDKAAALENRKRRIESDLDNNNTSSKGTGRKKVQRKVPVRKSRDNESDTIADL